MTQDDYELVLGRNVEKIEAAVTAAGLTDWRVVPGVIPFVDRADYFASWHANPTDETRDSIEGTLIKFVYVYLTLPEAVGGPVHSPLMDYHLRIYAFAEFDLERLDPDEVSASALARRMMRAHNEFIGLVLALFEEYEGNRGMGLTGLSEPFIVQETQPLTMESPATGVEDCEFIPEVVGFQASMLEKVRMQKERC